MPENEASHAEYIAHWLKLLEHPLPVPLSYEILQGGISGAATYRISHPGGSSILKVVPAQSPAVVLARGEREVEFYRLFSNRLPIATPEVLACHGPSSEGCALLLRAYDPMPEVAGWTVEEYRTAARELAWLHTMFWGECDKLKPYAWLQQPSNDLRGYQEDALAAWRALWEQERLKKLFGTAVIGRLEEGVGMLTGSDPAIRSAGLPYTLRHGDAHHGNVLRGPDGRWIWADWQETSIGLGPDDLSFFYQRATDAGGRVALRTMVRAYHEALENRLGTPVDFEAIYQVVLAIELTTRLLHWPYYLKDASESRIRRHLKRVLALLNSV